MKNIIKVVKKNKNFLGKADIELHYPGLFLKGAKFFFPPLIASVGRKKGSPLKTS